LANSLSLSIAQNVDALAVGVSGGPDSFALLHMASDWAQKHQVKIIALTIDHGLRPENAAEAEIIKEWCKAHDIDHHTLAWQGEKPKTGIQDAAREARRALLCDFCKQNDIPALLLAHHADDQMETILMRMQRGSGLRGILGMASTRLDTRTGVQIIRPLLGMRRKALRDYAVTHKLPFIDDPSNNNITFERPRVRIALSQLPDLADGIGLVSARLRRADDALDQLVDEWHDRHARVLEEYTTWIPKDAFLALPEELRLRTLHKILLQTNPNTRVPLDGLEDLVGAMEEAAFAGQTLAECWVKPKVQEKQAGFQILKAPDRRS
jgi:tRNA(Ile)-lysidine synthase